MMDHVIREKMFYNAVARAVEGNPSTMRHINERTRERYGELFTVWEAAHGDLYRYSDRRAPDPAAEWERLERHDIQLIMANESDFPPLVPHIPNPPLALYVRGTLPQPDAFLLSIVGTRRATPDGKSITRTFAQELAHAGLSIVSGLALGIDAAAHEGCLDAIDAGIPNAGTTLAVLGGGLDRFYPAENERLGRRILEAGGAIVSEYPVGEPSYPDRFIERNRIVAGFSSGVLVIECPERSGSQSTARHALEQNRDVFVVPGSIAHQNFTGSHQLIRQGATLVTCAKEIFEAYDMSGVGASMRGAIAANAEEKQIIQALQTTRYALDVDKIIEMTKLEPRAANQAISFLVLKHLIKETESGYIIE